MGRGQGEMGIGFEHTLPGELVKAGYHTQGVGKMHFYPQRSLNGFHNTVLDESGRVHDLDFLSDYREWFGKNKTGDYAFTDHGIGWNSWMARPYHAPEFLHPTNWTVNEGIRFIDQRDPNKPFFLKLSFARPHSPYDAPPCYFDMYLRKKLPKAVVGNWAVMHDVPSDAASPDAWRGVRSDEEINRARVGYYGSITHIDHQIGRFLYHLRSKKQFDNTLIIFTSDHGDMLGDHNLWRKTYAYEGSAHIPLLVVLPKSMKAPVQKKVHNPVTIQDIMPTILEAAGVDIPETVDGCSMLGLMSGERAHWREYVHGEHSTCYSEEQEMQFVTDGVYKFIWFPRLGTEQFFNLSEDPMELNDLSHDAAYADTVRTWRRRLIKTLEPRELGLTNGDQLVSQAGKPFMVSPNYKTRKDKVGGWLP
ncbi:arylsulfatase A-like enzyme [Paenibacillus qinlingensis]|uniref:Arylsulfatase A-like enzyme n=2 Tax=Paenibacillus qinlingensis TaxID=1837343 RepID=A0ABU1P116_9BACL|nr:arylsulfatase A-like enzyme [Paenibacillus qinlingensis]